MPSIEQTANDIKKKMQLMDYEAIPQSSNTVTRKEVNTPKEEKIKVSVYLTKVHMKMFNEMCLEEMKRTGKPEKSRIICDAIEMFYSKTMNN